MDEKQFKQLIEAINVQTLVLNAGFQTCAELLARINTHVRGANPNLNLEAKEAEKAIQTLTVRTEQAFQHLPHMRRERP